MERLTQWYDDGKIRGILVKDGFEENTFQTIVTKIDECYAAVNLLKEYEDIGLAPEQIRELKERDTAKEIQKVDEQPYFRKRFHSYICPVCHKKVESGWSFCGHCGQKLKRKD